MTLKSASGPPRHRIAKRDEHARPSRDPRGRSHGAHAARRHERTVDRSLCSNRIARRKTTSASRRSHCATRPTTEIVCPLRRDGRAAFLCERKTARQKFRTALRVMDRPKPIARTQSIDPNTYSSKRGAIDWPTSGLCSTNESVMRRTVADPTHPILPWAYSRSRRNNPREHGAVSASCRPIAEAAGLDETAGLDVKDRSETLPKK